MAIDLEDQGEDREGDDLDTEEGNARNECAFLKRFGLLYTFCSHSSFIVHIKKVPLMRIEVRDVETNTMRLCFKVQPPADHILSNNTTKLDARVFGFSTEEFDCIVESPEALSLIPHTYQSSIYPPVLPRDASAEQQQARADAVSKEGEWLDSELPQNHRIGQQNRKHHSL
jgi:hypothetical protein